MWSVLYPRLEFYRICCRDDTRDHKQSYIAQSRLCSFPGEDNQADLLMVVA